MQGQKLLSFDIPLFIKWAGGKNQSLKDIAEYLPEDSNSYFEPFVGGGAVFLFIKQNFSPKSIHLSDINPELINVYEVIKNNPEELINQLRKHKENNSKEYFYQIRGLNKNINYVKNMNDVERAARFIYLNKTCFNGLYRVNSKGKFNVPYGKYKNPSIFSKERILKVSELLTNVNIENYSYEKILDKVKPGDLVYLDPPYYPLKEESFTTYTKQDFTKEDHVKLASFYKKLDNKGAKVILSNSNAPRILQLYKEFNIHKIMSKRAINCNGKDRGEVEELLIINY